ncbi:MAG TPA: EamA family transporter [bacterium]|nr:EamA family transporter [bacterium]
MTVAALALVLAGAFIHALWNLLAKRAQGGAPFVCLFSLVAVAVYAPLAAAIVLWQRPHIGPIQLVFIAGTAVLHTGYFLALQQGYRLGDLSLVYPVARGTGPMLTTAAAIAFFGERPGPVALAGTALIGGGIILLTSGRDAWRRPHARQAAAYAVLTGMFIAGYSLWDKRAVTTFAVPPVVLDWGDNLGRAALLAPAALTRREEVREIWRRYRREVLLVGVLSPMPYILVLTALVFTPVSYVAPAREISILAGAVMGTRLLAEGDARRRIAAAGAMVVGLAALAAG